MIGKLRKKFILVSMASVFVVLLAIMAVINLMNFHNVTVRADQILELLAENGGSFPRHFSGEAEETVLPEKDAEDQEMRQKGGRMPEDGGEVPLSPETPYETRFFSVVLDTEGNVLSVDTSHIAALTDEEAQTCGQQVFQSGSEKGYLGDYRYLVSEGVDTTVIFADCGRDLGTSRAFLTTSIWVSGLGLSAVFLLVLLFSRIVFRPVTESYEKQKQFITDASHEIKTPLTIIDANTEVLEMEFGENRWTKSTRNQVNRLSALTRQLITLARMEESGGEKMVEFSLSDAVREAAAPYEALALAQNRRISLEIAEGLSMKGDEESIRRLVGILLDNAVKYSPSGAGIRVMLKPKGKNRLLSVENPAGQLPQGNLDVLFERFYRTDASRNSGTGGSGIGLSVARAIVQAHRGKITAAARDGLLVITAVL